MSVRRQFMPSAKPASPSHSLSDVLRAGLAIHMNRDEGRSVRPRLIPGSGKYVVTIAIPVIHVFDASERAPWGLSTDLRYQVTPEKPWRQMATIERVEFPKNGEFGTLDRICAEVAAAMVPTGNLHYELHDTLMRKLRSENAIEEELLNKVDAVVTLEGLLALMTALQPQADGESAYLRVEGDDDKKETALQLFASIREMRNALQHGQWEFQGRPENMSSYIGQVEENVDPVPREEFEAPMQQ